LGWILCAKSGSVSVEGRPSRPSLQ